MRAGHGSGTMSRMGGYPARSTSTIRRAIFWLAVALCARGAAADVPESQRAEVEHLLGFIEHSSCTFVRNGRSYDSERALRHVERKYDYFRDEITSTEEFVELAATRSTVSGKPYLFVCDGETRESRAVLLDELARFRAAGAARRPLTPAHSVT